jgi:MFS family permease
LFTVVLGFGHMFCMASHQMLAVRCANMRGRESAFGHYMVAVSTGQGLGPFIVGWLGGSSTVPATGYLFGIGAIAAVLCLGVALTLRPAPRPAMHANAGPVLGVGALFRMPGMIAVLMASVVTVTSLDLLIVYLPLVGAERHVDASDIGMLLAIRSVAALVARAFYSRLIVRLGRKRLTLASITVAAAACGAGGALAAADVSVDHHGRAGAWRRLHHDAVQHRRSGAGAGARHRAVPADHGQPGRPGAGAVSGEPDRGRGRHRGHIAGDRVHAGGVRSGRAGGGKWASGE